MYASWRDQRLKYKIKDFDRLSKLVYRGDLANDQMLRMWHPNLTIPNQIELVLIPISEDLSSKKEGDNAILKIASNEVLKIPLLDISFNPNYDEDLRIPILKENGGPVEAKLIKSSGNQNLELEDYRLDLRR